MIALFLLVAAALCFLVAALAPVFEWNLGKFNAIAWGLFFWVLTVVMAAWPE